MAEKKASGPINYDPAERDLGLKTLESGRRLPPPDRNGKRIVTYSFSLNDYLEGARDAEDRNLWQFSEIRPMPEADRHIQISTFQEFGQYTNISYIPFNSAAAQKIREELRRKYSEELPVMFENIPEDIAADTAKLNAEIEAPRPETVVALAQDFDANGIGLFPDQDRKPLEQRFLLLDKGYFESKDESDFVACEGGYDQLFRQQNVKKTTLHETGHNAGLAHPHNSRNPLKPDHPLYDFHSTVMVYAKTSCGNEEQRPVTLMPWDIAKLQQMYGVNRRTYAGNTLHKIEPQSGKLQTLWDGGGNDTLTIKHTLEPWMDYYEGVSLNLWEGVTQSSEIGANTYVHLAYGANIENAVGGKGDDSLIGNALDNRLTGGPGDDSFAFTNPFKGNESANLGHDVITDFEASPVDSKEGFGPLSLFEGEEDAIIGGTDMRKARVYAGDERAVVFFEDAQGRTIPGTSVTLEKFDNGFLWKSADDINIYRTLPDGDVVKLEEKDIKIIEGCPPAPSKNTVKGRLEDLKDVLKDSFTVSGDVRLGQAERETPVGPAPSVPEAVPKPA
jgi:hypothetical protein